MPELEYFDGCEAKHETDKALLVLIPEIDTKPQWVPKSVIGSDSQIDALGDEGVISIKTHWCKREGWV